MIINAGGGGGANVVLVNIAFTATPTKTSYTAGEKLDLTGATVTAMYSNGSMSDVTSECTFKPAAGTVLYEDTKEIVATFHNEKMDQTLTTSISINVARVLKSISIATAPDKTSYVAGDKFDSTGMTVTGLFTSGRYDTLTGWTTSPSDALYEDTTAVTVSYTEGGVTATASQAVTVQRVLSSIAVTTKPTSLEAKTGVAIDTTGMVVTGTFTSGKTAEVTGWTISPTVAQDKPGTQTITVSFTENGATATDTFDVNVSYNVQTGLEDNSWEIIHYLSQQGTAEQYFAVGDVKKVHVEGTVGTLAVNDDYNVYILGFDHNSDVEGKGVHFGCFKTTAGVDICLTDGVYGSEQTNGNKYFNMNHSSNTNAGGWKKSNIRYDVIGSTNSNQADAPDDTATNPVAGTLMAALPEDLRTVMQPMTKYSDNNGGGSDTAGYVTATKDFLWLLSEFEVQGARTYANSAEKNYQKQYQYYVNGNSKVKYQHNATTSAALWWLRSVYSGNTHAFCVVLTNGSASYSNAYNSFGLAPAFAV